VSGAEYSLEQFCADLDGAYRTGDAQSFWACEPFVTRFVQADLVQALVNERLRQLIDDPRRDQDFQIKEVVLRRSERWTLSVSLFDLPHRYVHALPYLSFCAPVGQALKAYVYRLPSSYRNELFDPAVQLEPVGPVATEPGQVLRLDSDSFAYDFQIPRPICVLRVNTAALRPLEWLFSKTTLQAWQANDADLAHTQLRVAATVLGKIAHQSSIEPLKQLATHPHHAVRWSAIQNLGRLSRSEALVKIKEAVNDPHPHVRRAAQKTLDQLNKR
jgi:hypothetical protein